MPNKKTESQKKIIFGGLALFFYLFCLGSAFALNSPPQTGTLAPAYGSSLTNTPVTFTTTFTDPNGWQDISLARLLINTSIKGSSGGYLLYYPATNKLYLYNDAGTGLLGGYAPGSANIIENSYAKLDCSKTTVTGSGATLTVKWNIVFKDAFVSSLAKNLYLYVTDKANISSVWAQKGTWLVGTNSAPSVGTITPASGVSPVNTPVTFTTTFTDPNGWQDIQFGMLLINTSVNGKNTCYGYYNQNTNKLYLMNDDGTSWLGGFAPGSANIIENSYAKLDCSKTTVSGSGITLTVKWNISFKDAFSGTTVKNTYLYVRDDFNATGTWQQKGTWLVGVDSAPAVGTITPSSGTSFANVPAVFTTTFTDPNGWQDIQFGLFLINTTVNGAKSFYGYYHQNTNKLYLINDAGTSWLGGFAPGSTNIIENSYAKLDCSKSTISGSGITLIVKWTVTFKEAFVGVAAKNTYLYVKDDSNVINTWAKKGTWNVVKKDPPVILITSPQDGAVVEDSPVQFQGTVDGVAFSESRTLVEGENTLTKTATDIAGNTASASVKVQLYSGQLIGADGGEVLSPDGKVKLIVPAEALTQPTRVRIVNLNNKDLQNATPGNKALLSAVQCKPNGLVFAKPASLIYTLYQAEVPGTPVELGLYDAVQDKIISTGQTSTVPADGYTLTFSLLHFSDYAALKSLTPQNIPIGTGVKIPLPDMLTGSFSHAIPITVAPGRKGMQPQVALNYRSSGANSWVGLGFGLNPGYIARSTRLGPPTYIDTTDTFYFVTDAGSTELVNLVDNLYQAKVESSFTKFYKEPDDSWRVVTKDGAVIRLGQSLDAKEASNQGTFAWYLTKAVDTNGNYIEYSYSKDQGKSYLTRIDYTGNEAGVSPTNSVEFILDSREDISSSYISSARIATVKRLKEIQVKVNNDLVWRYVLEYRYSPDTNRSLLISAKQLAADDKALPEQKFSYQQAK